MIRIFYDKATGAVQHTFSGDEQFSPKGDYIEVDTAPAGPLTCWKVADGALVPSGDLTGAYAAIREKRKLKLDACEWTQNADNSLSEEKRAEWRVYRKALRDFPETVADPLNPVWPNPPA